jgi:hypothetical protein
MIGVAAHLAGLRSALEIAVVITVGLTVALTAPSVQAVLEDARPRRRSAARRARAVTTLLPA